MDASPNIQPPELVQVRLRRQPAWGTPWMAARSRARWAALAVALLMESTGGLFYAFGLYSDAVKHRFGLSQMQLDTVASAGYAGCCVSVHF